MTRIAVGAFLHETNTFAPTKATYADFVHGGGWPAMSTGADVPKVMRRMNAGLAGFIEAAEAEAWELVPTISCGASPSAHVTRDAFERVVKVIVDRIESAGRLDGVYLDLHGAMVTEHLDDGEGEILARVRKVIGKDLPLVASLDLHANVTPQMIRSEFYTPKQQLLIHYIYKALLNPAWLYRFAKQTFYDSGSAEIRSGVGRSPPSAPLISSVSLPASSGCWAIMTSVQASPCWQVS